MLKNNGETTNDAVFCMKFSELCGPKVFVDKPLFDAFYLNEFQHVKSVCGCNPEEANMVTQLKKCGFRIRTCHESVLFENCNRKPYSLGRTCSR